MKYTCPKCDKIIESGYITSEIMQEIFAHEKTHKEPKDNED